MSKKDNRVGWGCLFLFTALVFIMPFISSCGKGGAASNVGLNTQLEILNLSPDLQPVNLYVHYVLQSTASYSYPYPSSYFYLNSLDTPLQVRSSLKTTTNIFSIDTALASNHKYSLFITGLLTDSLKVILTTDDNTAIPNVGFGKIRFINAAIQSNTPQANTGLDVLANGTLAFSNIKYTAVSNYIQLPAGNYNFQINQTGSSGTILPTPSLQTTTIQDGRLYTLYSYGVVGQVDTSAFGAAVLTNR